MPRWPLVPPYLCLYILLLSSRKVLETVNIYWLFQCYCFQISSSNASGHWKNYKNKNAWVCGMRKLHGACFWNYSKEIIILILLLLNWPNCGKFKQNVTVTSNWSSRGMSDINQKNNQKEQQKSLGNKCANSSDSNIWFNKCRKISYSI